MAFWRLVRLLQVTGSGGQPISGNWSKSPKLKVPRAFNSHGTTSVRIQSARTGTRIACDAANRHQTRRRRGGLGRSAVLESAPCFNLIRFPVKIHVIGTRRASHSQRIRILASQRPTRILVGLRGVVGAVSLWNGHQGSHPGLGRSRSAQSRTATGGAQGHRLSLRPLLREAGAGHRPWVCKGNARGILHHSCLLDSSDACAPGDPLPSCKDLRADRGTPENIRDVVSARARAGSDGMLFETRREKTLRMGTQDLEGLYPHRSPLSCRGKICGSKPAERGQAPAAMELCSPSR